MPDENAVEELGDLHWAMYLAAYHCRAACMERLFCCAPRHHDARVNLYRDYRAAVRGREWAESCRQCGGAVAAALEAFTAAVEANDADDLAIYAMSERLEE